MKKLLVTIALLGAVAYSYGQGTVITGNASALASIKPSDSAAVVMPAQSSGQIYTFALFAAPPAATAVKYTGANLPDVVSSLAGWSVVGYGANSATAAGRIIFSPATFPVTGFTGETSLFMVGWSGTGTWDPTKANSTYFGTSSDAQMILGGGAISSPTFWGTTAGASGPITLFQVVPEPSSFALAGLGAAALLIFRRRN